MYNCTSTVKKGALFFFFFSFKVDGGNIRLSSKIPGTDPNEGLLEVFLNGSWGAVCNEWFTYNDIPAKIACNELGYPGFDYFITDSSVYGDFSDLSPAIDYILCSEGENSILDCVRMPGNCSPQNYVALKCQGTLHTVLVTAVH